MSKKIFKYKLSPNTIRKANSSLIRTGITERTRNSYNGDINITYHSKNGLITKSFSNTDIKKAFEKALNAYAERI